MPRQIFVYKAARATSAAPAAPPMAHGPLTVATPAVLLEVEEVEVEEEDDEGVMVTVCGMVAVLLAVEVTSTAWNLMSEAAKVVDCFCTLPPPVPMATWLQTAEVVPFNEQSIVATLRNTGQILYMDRSDIEFSIPSSVGDDIGESSRALSERKVRAEVREASAGRFGTSEHICCLVCGVLH